jgi:predicted  nucleic acid-binding Zn-ribbon protein
VGNTGDGSQARANAWNTLSDRNLKTNITEMTGALEKIGKLSAYYYNWGVGTDTSRQFGVISQEVEAVLPEVVSRGGDGYLGLDYGKLSPLLIAGINEQQEQITEQEEQLTLIGPRIEQVEATVAQTEEEVTRVQVALDEQGNIIETQGTDLAEASSTLDSHRNLIEEQQTEVASMEGQVAGVSTTLTDVQGQVAQASTDIESVRNEITNLQQASEEIETIQTEVETISSQVTTDVTTINTDMAAMQARIEELETQVLGAEGSATIDVSTESATLVTADEDASFNTLTVTGQTSLYDLGVAGTFTAGVLTIDGIEGSVNTLTAEQPLRLQALGLSGIEMVGGKVAVDQGGTVKVKEGVIEGNDKIRGAVSIPSGQQEARVDNSWDARPQSLILTGSFNGEVWYENVSESGFTVKIESTQEQDVEVSWIALW